MRASFLAAAVVLASAVLPSSSRADDVEPWRFNATLYGWAIAVSGSTTVRNHVIDTNASFIDLVQKSDSLAGFMGYVEVDKGPVGVYGDLVFARLGFSADRTSYRNPQPGLSIATTANAALVYQLFIVEAGGVYELQRWRHSETSWTAVDGLLGFRYWNNSVTASLNAAATVDVYALGMERSFGIAIARADSIQWVDPVLGARLRHQFTPHQSAFLRGDIGGFGFGSRFSWQAVAAYSYAWHLEGGQQLAAVLGFRALGVDYASTLPGGASVAINQVLYGPLLGVSFRF